MAVNWAVFAGRFLHSTANALDALRQAQGESAPHLTAQIRRRSSRVPPQSKRRRLSLLTLPVVVAVGFLVVAKLTAWQRSDLIADLADCISHGETRDAV